MKIAGRNINNLRYANDTTLMAESEEELKSFFVKVKEESEKVGLKLNIQKTKIMASSPITSWQIDGETVADFTFLGSKINADGECTHEIKRRLLLEREVMWEGLCVFCLKWNGPRDALTQMKAGFPCSGLNAGSYFISQDEGMTESPV